MDISETPFSSDRLICSDLLINICKYRQGSTCCRYIFFPRDKRDFYCVKKIDEMKAKIDSDITNMTAKGDNCQGLPSAEK